MCINSDPEYLGKINDFLSCEYIKTHEWLFGTKFTPSYPEFNKITEAEILDLDNGLSIISVASMKSKPAEKVGIIFDAGNSFSKRVKYSRKIIDYYDSKGIKKIFCILSHEHMDHYNIFNLVDMGKWLRTVDSTAIYYEDIDIMSKLTFISNCKNKIPLKRKVDILKFGDISIKTYFSTSPVPTNKLNETSIVLHSDGFTFTGDQCYENIENEWMRNQKFFQVPHHGSDSSGNYKLAKRNKNAMPFFKHHKLPNKKVETYFDGSCLILKKY